jgi:hypothetical protein
VNPSAVVAMPRRAPERRCRVVQDRTARHGAAHALDDAVPRFEEPERAASLREVGHERGKRIAEPADLRDQGRDEDEHDARDHHDGEHGDRRDRPAPSETAPLEGLDGGVEGEREESRDR